jgi:hypothetical protein
MPDLDPGALLRAVEDGVRQLPPNEINNMIRKAAGIEGVPSELVNPSRLVPEPDKPHYYVAAIDGFDQFEQFVCAYMLHVLHGPQLIVQKYLGEKQVHLVNDEIARIDVLYQIGKVGTFDPGNAAMVMSVANKPGPSVHSLPYIDMRSDVYRSDKHNTCVSRHVVRQSHPLTSRFVALPTLLQQAIFYVQNGVWTTTVAGALLNTAVLDRYTTDQRQSTLRSLIMVLDSLPEFASPEAEKLYNLCLTAERTFEAFDVLMSNITEFI